MFMLVIDSVEMETDDAGHRGNLCAVSWSRCAAMRSGIGERERLTFALSGSSPLQAEGKQEEERISKSS